METITLKNLKAKYASKRELVQFLRIDCNVYLPHHKYLTWMYVRDILTNKKKVGRKKHPPLYRMVLSPPCFYSMWRTTKSE